MEYYTLIHYSNLIADITASSELYHILVVDFVSAVRCFGL